MEKIINLFRGGGENDGKFSTFAGVFTPTVLTILGAIMYLRLGWVVGNAGFIGAILIIILAHVITVSTGLAVSSIATNTRVGAGGAFAIISQSLGLEVGGSVGIPLFMAQGISIALYVLAFGEGWMRIFPEHNYVFVCIITYALVFGVAYISAQFAAKIQFVILAIVGFSLFSLFLGSFPIAGQAGLVVTPDLWGDFSQATFWETFAIFFPAVTGIMAGISMSGSLRDPRGSIPSGTMGGIGLTMVIYLILAYWLSAIALPEDLLSNNTIMVDKAFWGWTILAGMLGATFSSALGSIVAAPRVMQALAVNKILPFSDTFSYETKGGEPRPAMIFTGGLGFVALLIALASGGLDAVAGIITMFFLITYGMLNVVVLIEQNLRMVTFRPLLQVPRTVPFIGMVGCVFVMFLVNPVFSLLAMVFVFGVYGYLVRRKLETNQTDVRSGLFSSMAEWAAIRAARMPASPERTWKPTLLVPVSSTSELTGSYRFIEAIAKPQGAVHSLGIFPTGNSKKLNKIELLTEALRDAGIYSRLILLEEDEFVRGVRLATQVLRRTFFRPNLLFLNLRKDSDIDELQQLVENTAAYDMGIMLLARHPVVELGREHFINVWVSRPIDGWHFDTQQSNLDLAVLIAYQLAQNWNGEILLCMALQNEEERENAEQLLHTLIELTRLPKNTKIWVHISSFEDALRAVPHGDVQILGLPEKPDLKFYSRIVGVVGGSCVFLRDSGTESAFA